MELEEARQLYAKAQTGLEEAMATVKRAMELRDGMAQIVSGLIRAFPELRQAEDGIEIEVERPRGAEAVRIILEENPESGLEASSVVARLRERGWLPESENPGNAVRAALERLIISEPARFGKVPGGRGEALVYFSRAGAWRNIGLHDDDEELS